MIGDNRTPAGHTNSSTQRRVSNQNEDDAELIAYYDEQRRTSKSDEWVACLHATIRQLRQS
ncbi:MAG TPA: hypothetical protein VD837_01350 [Terriglobales bacterium]|nr:hypothetical protein [Terriglobales bacterium]